MELPWVKALKGDGSARLRNHDFQAHRNLELWNGSCSESAEFIWRSLRTSLSFRSAPKVSGCPARPGFLRPVVRRPSELRESPSFAVRSSRLKRWESPSAKGRLRAAPHGGQYRAFLMITFRESEEAIGSFPGHDAWRNTTISTRTSCSNWSRAPRITRCTTSNRIRLLPRRRALCARS